MNENNSPRFNPNSDRFKGALALAAELHADQTRKSTDIPYVEHLLGVASIAIEYGAGEDEAIAALLHDAAEDRGGRSVLDMIRERFGSAVADIVESCTDTFEDPKPDWIVRKVRYVAHVRESTPSARLVSAADKLHNARAILRDYRAIGDEVFKRFKRSKYHVLWYYRSLAREFLFMDDNELNKELGRVSEELERLVFSGSPPEELAERDKVYDELDALVRNARAGEHSNLT
jgi:(p)ppGpp synthase/HD superfamily hydrolase